MADEAELQEWWDLLSDDSRDQLKQAVDTYPLNSSVTKLLFDTRCPALPVGAKWETQEGYSFNMPSTLRRSRDFARRRWPFGQLQFTRADGFLG